MYSFNTRVILLHVAYEKARLIQFWAPVCVKGGTKPQVLMAETKDVDVEIVSNSLSGMKILVGITGGIAAVDSVRLLREIRRHGGIPIVVMTKAAQQIISPLAIEWASQSQVIIDWEADMAQLEEVDAVLVCPATRYTIASHIHGIMDTPLQMAMSAARGRGIPILFVPSMHNSLSSDPITEDLTNELIQNGNYVLWGPHEEGRRKTPDTVNIVAEFSHIINSSNKSSKVIITIGATRSPIDHVRWIQNTSTGKTGWKISDYLYRMGHDVIVVHGETTSPAPTFLKNLEYHSNPDDMLNALLLHAKSENPPDSWVHCAAVLDYIPSNYHDYKLKSDEQTWLIELNSSKKHINELTPYCDNTIRIGFKLESNVSHDDLIESAKNMINKYQLNGVFANLLESVNDETTPRAFWVNEKGVITTIKDNLSLAMIIDEQISR